MVLINLTLGLGRSNQPRSSFSSCPLLSAIYASYSRQCTCTYRSWKPWIPSVCETSIASRSRVENTADWKEIPSIGARGGGGKRQSWPAVLGTVIPAVGLMCPKRPAERRSRWSDKSLEIELNLFLFFSSLLSF
jgi:hypothetical protein